ncbi:MAG TPA: SAM-dependent methyltransferase, partial [Phenylobacterium sp.]|nr:SAM-dependent methyltransferase [Phenylobacterium sp.]
HGLAAEIVPGVTAACAAAAQFGLPLTHRGVARRVVMATATKQDGELTMDWAAAADAEATLAIYMGGRAAPVIARRLIAAGRSAHTPVAVVSNASAPSAQFQGMTLSTLAAAHCLGLEAGPALILVGEALAASEAWLPSNETERLVGAA